MGAKSTAAKEPSRQKATPKKRTEFEGQIGVVPAGPRTEIVPAELTRMIAEAAYLRAEKRGFVGGQELDDWLEAEAEIKRLLTPEGSA